MLYVNRTLARPWAFMSRENIEQKIIFDELDQGMVVSYPDQKCKCHVFQTFLRKCKCDGSMEILSLEIEAISLIIYHNCKQICTGLAGKSDYYEKGNMIMVGIIKN